MEEMICCFCYIVTLRNLFPIINVCCDTGVKKKEKKGTQFNQEQKRLESKKRGGTEGKKSFREPTVWLWRGSVMLRWGWPSVTFDLCCGFWEPSIWTVFDQRTRLHSGTGYYPEFVCPVLSHYIGLSSASVHTQQAWGRRVSWGCANWCIRRSWEGKWG